ncbi:MAG: hypothetical protein U1F71_06500 [Verrucomicrobiaceae bacterium]
MEPEHPPKPEIGEIDRESLIPNKGVRLTPFALLAWTFAGLIVATVCWVLITQYNIGRFWGADYYVKTAKEAVDRKDWQVALGAIQRVDQRSRTSPKFLQTLADFLKGTRAEPALLASTLARLEEAGQLRQEDYLWLCRSSLAAGNVKAARATLGRIPASLRESLDIQELNIAILSAEGRQSEADEARLRLFARFPNHPQVAFLKAVRDLEGTFPEVHQAALTRLWEIARQPDEHGLRAIRVLGGREELTLAEIQRLQQLVEKHPDAALEDRLNLATKIIDADPEQHAAIVQDMVARYKNEGPVAKQLLAAWLARQKEYKLIVDLVPKGELIRSAELFPAAAHGLAQQERWTELLDLLTTRESKLPVSRSRVASWRALAIRNLRPGDLKEARSQLEDAIRKGGADKDLPGLLSGAALAETWNMTDLALEACQKLAEPGSPREVDMLEKCWLFAAQLKDEEAMVDAAGRLAQLQPDNVRLSLRRDYLRLLRGEDMELALISFPGERGTSELLEALKAYRLHDITLARELLGRVQDDSILTAGQRAVFAGLLATIRGDTTRAFAMAEKIQPELLLPAEKQFLNQAL